MVAHAFERNILAGLSDGKNLAGILAGEEAFGNADEEITGGQEHEHRDGDGNAVMPQRSLESPIVTVEQRVEEALGGGVEAPVLLMCRRLDEAAAEHRCEGE